MKKVIVYPILVFCLSITNYSYAQDPVFTQFYSNPLYLNPAFAGSAKCPRFTMNYRNQWSGITSGAPVYSTYSASYDQHIRAIGGGIGILLMQDDAGDGTIKTTNASAIYTSQVVLNRKFSIKMGLQSTLMQKTLTNKLTFGDQIDPRAGFIFNTQETDIGVEGSSMRKTNIDFSAGALLFSQKYFMGFAASHLTQPDEGFIGPSKLPLKITAHAGAYIPIGSKEEEISISPNILFRKQQNFQELNLGIYINKGPITGGLWYRNNDAFALLMGFRKGLFKFGYSYDVTVSKLLNSNSAGSHEISMAIQIKCKPHSIKYFTHCCPHF